jgi:predicted kinase/GNAT superfamily N-acetyltransferase
MNTTALRLASPDDAPAISGLVLRCLNEVNIKDYGPALVAEQAKGWTQEGVLLRIRERVMFVAVDGDKILGVAGFDGKQARTVFVSPDWHTKGVGKLLMRAVEDLAVEAGRSELSVLSSITAQSFYMRLGYQPVQDVFHGEERTILMRKALTVADPCKGKCGDLAVYAMCGIAFSGKSTVAHRVAAALQLTRISLDDINQERGLHGGEGIPDARWEEASFIAMARLRKCLQQGRSAVVDDTFSHRFLRDRCKRVAEACGASFTILFIDTPLSEIQARRRSNDLVQKRDTIQGQVFEHHVGRFEFPADDERVVRLSCDQDLERWITAASIKKSSPMEPTDYDTIARRYAEGTDKRP